MRFLIVISFVIMFLFVNSTSSFPEYMDTYNEKILYHFKYNYRPKLNLPRTDTISRKRVKRFKERTLYDEGKPGTTFEYAKNGDMDKYFILEWEKGKYLNATTVSSFFDVPPIQTCEESYFSSISNYRYGWPFQKSDMNISALPDYSIAFPETLPIKYRVWSGEKQNDSIPYLGMVDDDLLYNVKDENMFNSFFIMNKDAVFIYIYDFDDFRKKSQDWVIHDRLAYGYTDSFEEDKNNKARLTYSNLIEDINHLSLRTIRAGIYTRMYLAKLRLLKMVYPAPRWGLDENKDYPTFEQSKKLGYVQEVKRSLQKLIDQSSNIATKKGFTTGENYMLDQLKTWPAYDYWRYMKDIQSEMHKSKCTVKDILLSFSDITSAKRLGLKNYERLSAEGQKTIMKFRLYKSYMDAYTTMALRSPTKEQREDDFKDYYDPHRISIGIWSGTTGCAGFRHAYEVGLKTSRPYFDRKDLKGHMGNHEYKLNDTSGLIYGGHIDLYPNTAEKTKLREELIRYHKSMKQMWRNALRGPLTIVSSRTYKRYGHKYFEKIAGHKVICVDITGAIIDSNARVMTSPDIDYIKQIVDMDYFYVKKNKNQKLGLAKMRPASKITINTSDIKKGIVGLKKYGIKNRLTHENRNNCFKAVEKSDYNYEYKKGNMINLANNAWKAFEKNNKIKVSAKQKLSNYLRNKADGTLFPDLMWSGNYEDRPDSESFKYIAKLRKIAEKVQTAYQQDNKLFQGISLLQLSFLGMLDNTSKYDLKKSRPNIFTNNISCPSRNQNMISTGIGPLIPLQKNRHSMKTLVKNVKEGKYGSMKNFALTYLAKNYPQFAANPNLFLVYAENIYIIRRIVHSISYISAEKRTGRNKSQIIMNTVNCRHLGIPRNTPIGWLQNTWKLCNKDELIKDKVFPHYLEAYESTYYYKTKPIADPYFMERYHMIDPSFCIYQGIDPRIIKNTDIIKYYPENLYSTKTPVPSLLKMIYMSENDGLSHEKGLGSDIMMMFPGLFTARSAHVFYNILAFYSHYHLNKRDVSAGNPHLSNMVHSFYPNMYEPQLMTKTYLSILASTKKYRRLKTSNSSYQISQNILTQARYRNFFPLYDYGVVETVGLPTTVIKKKNRLYNVWSDLNEKLFNLRLIWK